MPEGDTLFRIATTLQKALAGARVTRFASPLPLLENALALHGPLEGQLIRLVEAKGKNLLIHFADGRALRTHLRMSGSWHIYREGEEWQRPALQARAELHASSGFVAVIFNAPVVELLSPAQLRRSDVHRLGPDATTDAFDAALALQRLRELPQLSVAEALLRQTSIAGIGNVVKSEALFRCRQDPFAKVGEVSEAQLARLIEDAHQILLHNRVGGPRMTTVFKVAAPAAARAAPAPPGPAPLALQKGARLWVYGRRGAPCRVCSTPIQMRRVGPAARSTYYCPACQASAADRHALSPTPEER